MGKNLHSVKILSWITFHLQDSGLDAKFEFSCPAYRYCVSTIKVEFGEAKIPYTIKAYNKDNPEEKCEEDGFLFVKNHWDLDAKADCCKSSQRPCPKAAECGKWSFDQSFRDFFFIICTSL